MHIRRRLIVLICGCLALVGISAGLEMNKQQRAGNPEILVKPVVVTDIDIPKADPTFIDEFSKNETKVSAKQTTKSKVVITDPNGISGLTAKAYLVGNVNTGKIYLEKNSSKALPVASMSKLVTAFVATDMMDLSTIITISSSSLATAPDYSNLTLDERFTLQEILEPLLLSSSNIAAEAIATSSAMGYTKFMEMMSSYAWEIGMPRSFFADPSGISPYNIASARDLFELAKYLVKHRPDILAVTRTAETEIATTTEHGGHRVVSTHPFVDDSRFIGGKTGRTEEAGETMMTILRIDDQPIVFIILGSSYGSRENDTRILLREFER